MEWFLILLVALVTLCACILTDLCRGHNHEVFKLFLFLLVRFQRNYISNKEKTDD